MLKHTKKELDYIMLNELHALIKHCGSFSFTAKMLNIPVTTVQGWVRRDKISKEGAVLVSLIGSLKDKFYAKSMRPDLTDGEIKKYKTKLSLK